MATSAVFHLPVGVYKSRISLKGNDCSRLKLQIVRGCRIQTSNAQLRSGLSFQAVGKVLIKGRNADSSRQHAAVASVEASEASKDEGTDRETGFVSWFDGHKGFGFIISDRDNEQLFVHHTQIHKTGHRSLGEGEPVEFVRGSQNGKPQAWDVTGPKGEEVNGLEYVSLEVNKLRDRIALMEDIPQRGADGSYGGLLNPVLAIQASSSSAATSSRVVCCCKRGTAHSISIRGNINLG
eukprot:CAMPEP_0198206780 /NCGR_PEP_ID=MMETSP1445-20131203/10325_1 /TAXON_ID=36898 /ORGANISM="Pyramimonas sp., Strain CCMP2087" /LENGTH=236 /DNA_ID=CAMNT_0043879617 /DNA_START=193 /DNA_END=903 /DNA_ORIENTATION=-